MTTEDKQKYNVDAVYEQSCREELQQRPLTSRRGKASAAAAGADQPADSSAAQDLPTNMLEAIAGTFGVGLASGKLCACLV